MKARAGFIFLALSFFASPEIRAQFTADEIAERPKWEKFLKTAAIVDTQPLGSELAVTNPWKLSLRKDKIIRNALWKNPRGTQGGFYENWMYEIAAYRMDKWLGLNMVPPTVEKRFRGKVGSCQLWIENTVILREKHEEGIEPEIRESQNWKRTGYLQQVFDNLIGNEDRNMGNVLLTSDNRPLLIDHSRTFRTSKAFTESLPFSEDNLLEGAEIMRELPRALVEKIAALEPDIIRDAVGKYLTNREIQAIMDRKVLILKEIERLISLYGEASVLY